MSGSIKKIIKKIPFVGSYVKKVQTEKKEEEQKQKLEKKRLDLQKEQERIKVWLKSEKQNAPDKNSRKISVIVHHHTGEEQLQKLKENFKEAAAGLECLRQTLNQNKTPHLPNSATKPQEKQRVSICFFWMKAYSWHPNV